MPVPNPASREDWPNRLALQAAIFSCYLLVAIALLFSAWRMSASTEMMDHLLVQQTQILHEIRQARETIPDEVKSAIPDVLRGKIK